MDYTDLVRFLDTWVEQGITPGVDCIITQNNREVFRHIAGYRDVESKTPLDGNEEYLIFSMTKLLTCVCALQLLEQNRYFLDDPIARYLPEFSHVMVKAEAACATASDDVTTGKSFGEKSAAFSAQKEATSPITVRHLFSMSAGLNYDLGAQNIMDTVCAGGRDTQSVVRALSKAPLEFEPGTHFRYSLCHDVLGALIEVWSGEKFGEYLQEHICIPLGLQHTYFSKKDNANNKRLLSLYDKNADGFFEKRPLLNPFVLADNYESGGAGLISCTKDYSVFISALANDGVAANGYRILRRETIEQLKTNQLCPQAYADFQNLRPGYGYGLGVRTHMEPFVSHSLSPVGEFGWDGAAGSFSMIDPVNRITLTNFQHCFSWDPQNHHALRNAFYRCLKKSD